MFPVKRLLLLLPLVALLSSCSEDFEVAAPYKDVTVIYGLMDVGDTAHYIRVQKAFLDENKSALDMARNPDSNFYSSIEVHLKEFANGTQQRDDLLQRVDLNLEHHMKDSGVFFNAPNYVYKSTRPLIPGNTYRLVVRNLATGQVDSAETPIIENKAAPPPRGFVVFEFYNTFQLAFAAQLETNKVTLTVQVPEHAQIFESIVRFHYVDRNTSGFERRDSVEWRFASGTRTARPIVELSALQRSFFYFLRDAIGPAPAGVERRMDSVDLFVLAGSTDLANYQTINGAQGGITADQIKPIYTNIRSNRVNSSFGLFTTRAKTGYHDIAIDSRTLDSLARNPITAALRITGRTDD